MRHLDGGFRGPISLELIGERHDRRGAGVDADVMREGAEVDEIFALVPRGETVGDALDSVGGFGAHGLSEHA